jgi:hypothetical protein
VTGQPTTGARRPMTPEDLFAFSIVSDPQPAPDGSSIAYVVTRLDQEADDYKAAIWLAPTDGGAPVQLTSGAFRRPRNPPTPTERQKPSPPTRDPKSRSRRSGRFAWPAARRGN